jgi:sigma-E factor negative regulatory protein RseC
MIEETATVVKVEKGQVWVNSEASGGCTGCIKQSSCTSSMLGKFFKPRHVAVDSSFPLAVGDQVVVAIDESLFLHASLLLYIVPLLAMFIGAGMTESLLDNALPYSELYIALVGLFSLFFSLGLLHLMQKKGGSDYCVKAVVVKKL